MTKRDGEALMVIVSLFFILFVMIGGSVNSVGVFLVPFMKEFGWTRTQVSLVPTLLGMSLGFVSPLAGWLLDRIEAKLVMTVGALIAAGGFVAASRAESLPALIGGFVGIGVGVGASALVPCGFVAAKWFVARRGVALGVVIAGGAVGGMAMPIALDRVIAHWGWRRALLTVAVIVVGFVIPLILVTIRTPPRSESETASTQPQEAGVELKTALTSGSFWSLAATQLLGGAALGGAFYHLVPYLVNAGFSSANAALVTGIQAGFIAPGVLIMGALADRIAARWVLALSQLVLGGATLLLLDVSSGAALLVAFVVAFGLSAGATTSVTPALVAQAFGLRRFGTISGLLGMAQTAAAGLGPLMVGRLFDLTGRYTTAFLACAGLLLIASVAAVGVRPVQEVACAPEAAAQL
jgi:MFS family permease